MIRKELSYISIRALLGGILLGHGLYVLVQPTLYPRLYTLIPILLGLLLILSQWKTWMGGLGIK